MVIYVLQALGHGRLVRTVGTSNIVKTNTNNIKNAETRAISSLKLWSALKLWLSCEQNVLMWLDHGGLVTVLNDWDSSQACYKYDEIKSYHRFISTESRVHTPKPQMIEANANWIDCLIKCEVTEGFRSCQWAISTQPTRTHPLFLRNFLANFRAFYPNT